MNRNRTVALGALGLATAITVAAMPAHASAADVVRRGSCSGSATWKLKASPENGRIEVEGEVDANRNGQTWRWRILHNGRVAARGTATTRPPSGSFEVRRLLVNTQGADSIGWRARNVATGQTCRGGLTF